MKNLSLRFFSSVFAPILVFSCVGCASLVYRMQSNPEGRISPGYLTEDNKLSSKALQSKLTRSNSYGWVSPVLIEVTLETLGLSLARVEDREAKETYRLKRSPEEHDQIVTEQKAQALQRAQNRTCFTIMLKSERQYVGEPSSWHGQLQQGEQVAPLSFSSFVPLLVASSTTLMQNPHSLPNQTEFTSHTRSLYKLFGQACASMQVQNKPEDIRLTIEPRYEEGLPVLNFAWKLSE